MEHLRIKTNEPHYEADGPPQLFAVGCFNGEVHILRFGMGDGIYDVKREADRIRREWHKPKRLAKQRGVE